MEIARASNLGLAPSLALEWIARDAVPRLIVNEDLLVLWENKAAQGMLRARRDLELRDGAIVAMNASQHEAFAGFVRRARSEVSSMVLSLEEGDGHLIVRAQAVGRSDSEVFVGLQFYRTGEHKFEYADFKQAFGLTPAEHSVLLRMLDGMTADEISSAKNLSIDTIRSQIKQIYEKLNVSSREELFRKIRPYSH